MRNWACGREMSKYAGSDLAESTSRIPSSLANLGPTVCRPNINSQRRIEQCLQLPIKAKKAWHLAKQAGKMRGWRDLTWERNCFAVPLWLHFPPHSLLLVTSVLHKTCHHSLYFENSDCSHTSFLVAACLLFSASPRPSLLADLPSVLCWLASLLTFFAGWQTVSSWPRSSRSLCVVCTYYKLGTNKQTLNKGDATFANNWLKPN